jgi:hypothetical protein
MDHVVKISAGNAGLKCDNPKCDWSDQTILDSEARKWINAPCPKCGENLLTLEDYNNFEAMMSAIELMNSFSLEDLELLTKDIDVEKLKQSPFLKDAIGLDILDDPNANSTTMLIDTHKTARVTEIKRTPPEDDLS